MTGGIALVVIGGASVAVGVIARQSGPPTPPSGGLVAAGYSSGAQAPAQASPALVSSTLDNSPATHLSFPRMRIDTELMVLDVDDAGEVRVPPDDPGAPAGWYGRGSSPGEIGPTVILGHVDTRTGPGVFYGLGATRIDDRVSVTRMDGRVAHYTVTRVVSYPQDAFPTEEVYGDTAGSELRLITCGGRFDRAKGGYLDNIVVYGTLTGIS